MTTPAITAFIAARLGDDEADALSADLSPWEAWSAPGGGLYVSGPDETFGIHPGHHGEDGWRQAERNANHIARHDPVRVLADVAAHRAILAIHETISAAYPGCTIESDPCCRECSVEGEYPGGYPCPTLRVLAAIWADHAGYSEGWAL